MIFCKKESTYLDSLTRGFAEIVAIHRGQNISVLVNVFEYILKAPKTALAHADYCFEALGV